MTELWISIASGFCVFFLLVWTILSVMYSCAGTWERCDEETSTDPHFRERITLGQFGPIVVGRRDLTGGHQAFWGLSFWRILWLRRRDYGLKPIMQLGFPESIAPLLEGAALGKLKLRLLPGNTTLEGLFVPYRVEYTARPPHIDRILSEKPKHRRYQRVELARSAARSAEALPSD